ncbi:putative diguanylate cyclase YegE [Thalassocella blandensis]|nr:putative diguanylate cyclase YegE [Thalassocella blandensis]
MTFVITTGYGIYHVQFGIVLIGYLALASAIFCALTMWQLVRSNPLPVNYYGVVLCQFFALLLTCYFYGIRGLVLVTPFVSGVFFLFPFRNALWLSCFFVGFALIASYPSIELKLYIRLAVAQIITLFFTIAFSHVVYRQQALLEKEAYYDYLTEVLNRRGFFKWLTSELQSIESTNSDLALFYLDLDKFKAINDTYGHPIGDKLLVAFANRILSALRHEDLIRSNLQVCNFARIAGDEFALAISQLHSKEAAKTIATRIMQAIDQPFRFEDVVIHVSMSVGICFASQSKFDLNRLFKNADSAMYFSKSSGRNQANFYLESDQPSP